MKTSKYRNFCADLVEMCDKFGQSPCDYLFNGLDCAHTKLVVDMTIFNVWIECRHEEDKKRESKARLQHASSK